MADLMGEIEARMVDARRRSRQRRVVFRRMEEIRSEHPWFRYLPTRVMSVLTRISLWNRPPEEVSRGER